VFPDALAQVTGDPDVQRPVLLAGHDVDARLFHRVSMDSRFRGNDGVIGPYTQRGVEPLCSV
jgi:hypothetical protein